MPPGMSLAGARLLARWCPAQRWREPDLRLSCGTWEGASRHSLAVRAGRQGVPQAYEAQEAEYRRGARRRTGS